jgi:molybdopterin molybdotransferase
MPEFLNLLPPPEALRRLLEHVKTPVETETIPTTTAFGRVLARPAVAPYPLPSFARSTVDGYALRASDTFGASGSLPAYLRLIGEAHMGRMVDLVLGRGDCVLIHTGGMLPQGADGVVMIENTQVAREGEVELFRAVARGENILQVGEDVRAGDEVISAGVRLRAPEIGGLMALGQVEVVVYRRPRVGILSSGDEVVSPDLPLEAGQVRDINSYSLAALIAQHGGQPALYGVLPDEAEALFAAAQQALQETDLVVITAGSSASARDLTAEVISRLGRPGVLVHGVDVRPGKPTILAICDGKPIVGLPGNPVSALVVGGLFIPPALRRLEGEEQTRPTGVIQARLTLNLASQAGREDWAPVRLIPEGKGYRAEPVFGKSNLIFTLVRADGLVRIPPSAVGLEANSTVDVTLL